MSNTQDSNPDFIRQMWQNMGFGLPGMAIPTMDVDELERRITDFRAVEGWLKMNLNMLQMTIQGLEMQRATLSAMRSMTQPDASGEMPANPFANPALWSWPFATATAEPAADDTPPPDTGATPEKKPRSKK